MAFSVVQSAKGNSASANPALSLGSNVAAGDTIAIMFGQAGSAAAAGTPTVTVAGVSQTVTLIESHTPSGSGEPWAYFWTVVADRAGTCACTFSSTAVHQYYELAELLGTASVDVHGTANSPTATTVWSITAPSATSNATELVLAFFATNNGTETGITYDAAYTSIATVTSANGCIGSEYKITTATETSSTTVTPSVSAAYTAIIVTFLPAPTFVQGNQTSGTTDASKQITIGYTAQNNAAGDLLVVSIATLDTVSVTGITDSAGNTWVKAIPDTSLAGATKISTWIVATSLASSGGTSPFNTLTITTSTVSADIGVVLGEYSAAGNVVDVSGTGTGTGNSPSIATSAATSVASELVIAAIAAYANVAASSGNTTTQTEDFPTTLDHYASGGTIASGETEAFDSTHDSTLHASSGSGSAQSKILGKTKGPTTGFIQQANTWASLFGIPSNATITGYSVSYDWSCTAATGPSGTPQLQLQTWHNGTAARNGTAVNGTAKTFTTTTAWATATNDVNVTGLSEAATQWATFAFQPTMSTSSASTSNVVTVNYDHIVITVTYSLPAQAVSFTAGTGWALRENTAQASAFHGDAALEDEVLATAGTATATWTLANQGGWAAQVIAFKTAVGPTTYTLTATENVAHASGWDDAVTSVETYFRATSEPSSSGDSVASLRIVPRAPSAETVAFGAGWDASVGRSVTAQRAVSEAIAFAQGWDASSARSALFLRVPGSEAVAVAQGWDASATSARTFTRALLEAIAVAQGWDASVTRAALSLLRPAPTELIAHAQGWDDALARRASYFRGQNEASLAGDAVSAGRSYARSVIEAISHAQGWDDATARRLFAVRSLTEAVSHAAGWDDAGPSVARTQSLAITEAVAHAQGWDDAIITRATFVRGQTEGGFPADVASRLLLAFRARTENVSAGSGWDASAAFRGSYFRSVIETVAHGAGWDDSAIGAKTFLRPITENVGVAQTWDASVGRSLLLFRSALEAVGASQGWDAAASVHDLYLRAIAEPSLSADSAIGFKAFFRSVPSEAIAFASGWDASVTRRLLALRSTLETGSPNDVVSLRLILSRSILESIAAAQGWDATAVGFRRFARSTVENVAVAQAWDASVARLLFARRVLAETSLVTDTPSVRQLLARQAVESVASARGWDAVAVSSLLRVLTVAPELSLSADAIGLSLLRVRAVVESLPSTDSTATRLLLLRSLLEAVSVARGWDAAASTLFIPSHQPFIIPIGRVIRGEDGTLVVTGEPSPLDVRSGYAETLREDV